MFKEISRKHCYCEDERFMKDICNELWIVRNGGVNIIRCLDSSEFCTAFDQYANSLR